MRIAINFAQVAEDLYTKGWISYPRTETDSFDKGIDLRRLVEKQVQDQAWGPYAQGYTKIPAFLMHLLSNTNALNQSPRRRL